MDLSDKKQKFWQLRKFFPSNKNNSPINRYLSIIAGIGILFFLLVSLIAPFKYNLFNQIFPKKSSHAATPATLVTIKDTNYIIPTSNVYFVATNGSDTNNGTSVSTPFQTIAKAVSTAPPGATIIIRAGIYRESVSLTKPVTIQPYPHEQVWMKGSQVLTSGWVSDSTGVWRLDNWTTKFTHVTDINELSGAPPEAALSDQVFINGAPLNQVTSRASVVAGTFYIDETNTKLYIGSDPTGQIVEGVTMVYGLRVAPGSGITGVTIRGIGFQQYSPTYDGASAVPPQGGVSMQISSSTVENCTFAYISNKGLYMAGTDNVVQGNIFVYNGEGGFGGGTGSHRLLFEKNYLAFNNTQNFNNRWSASGAKIGTSDDAVFRDNVAENNKGPGLWCDWECHNNIFVRNVVRNNVDGIEYEKSSGAIIASNLIYGNSGYGIVPIGSNDSKIYNNTLSKNISNLKIIDDNRLTGETTVASPYIPAPGIVINLIIKNNIISISDGLVTTTGGGYLDVDDFTDTKTGEQMVSANDYNAYYRTASNTPTRLINWEKGVVGDLAHYNSVSAFTTAKPPRESHSNDIIQSTNPFFVNETNDDFALLSTSVAKNAGEALPTDVANAINGGLTSSVVTAGSAIDIGAIKWIDPASITPSLTPTPTATPTPTPSPLVSSNLKINAPLFTTSADYSKSAIAWFGKVSSNDNYSDIRIGYTNTELSVDISSIDRLLFYDTTPTAIEMKDYDSVELLIKKDGASGSLPTTTSYRFLGELNWFEARTNYQVAYQGNGTTWIQATIPFSTVSGWRGNAPNDTTDDKGWTMHFTIPFSSLGLTGAPVNGTSWAMAVIAHDRDDAVGTVIKTTSWPGTTNLTAPLTWGQLGFGLPNYQPPTTSNNQTIKVQQNLNSQTVKDAAVGGYTNCGGSLDYWTQWGNQNYTSQTDFNVQNESDISDFPCFSKYYVTFPLSTLPAGKKIVSAKLTLHHFGNSDPTGATPSWIQVLKTDDSWNESTITWNNAPPALYNISGTTVNPVSTTPAWPGIAYDFDVTAALAESYTSNQPMAYSNRHSSTITNCCNLKSNKW
jgi:parallel beta-helix repeat protein